MPSDGDATLNIGPPAYHPKMTRNDSHGGVNRTNNGRGLGGNLLQSQPKGHQNLVMSRMANLGQQQMTQGYVG